MNEAKIANTEKAEAIKKLHEISVRAEKDFIADKSEENFEKLIQKECEESWKWRQNCF